MNRATSPMSRPDFPFSGSGRTARMSGTSTATGSSISPAASAWPASATRRNQSWRRRRTKSRGFITRWATSIRARKKSALCRRLSQLTFETWKLGAGQSHPHQFGQRSGRGGAENRVARDETARRARLHRRLPRPRLRRAHRDGPQSFPRSVRRATRRLRHLHAFPDCQHCPFGATAASPPPACPIA